MFDGYVGLGAFCVTGGRHPGPRVMGRQVIGGPAAAVEGPYLHHWRARARAAWRRGAGFGVGETAVYCSVCFLAFKLARTAVINAVGCGASLEERSPGACLRDERAPLHGQATGCAQPRGTHNTIIHANANIHTPHPRFKAAKAHVPTR
jgi:hypothetical protein